MNGGINNMNDSQNMGNVLTEVLDIKDVTKFNSENFQASNSKSNSRSTSDAGAMTIVNSVKHGRRITIAKCVMDALKNCTSLQFSFNENSIAIAEKLPNNESYFSLRKSGTKSVTYSSQLIKEITDVFQLDFSSRVSITFHDVEYLDNGEYPVAIIKVKEPVEQHNEAELINEEM